MQKPYKDHLPCAAWSGDLRGAVQSSFWGAMEDMQKPMGLFHDLVAMDVNFMERSDGRVRSFFGGSERGLWILRT